MLYFQKSLLLTMPLAWSYRLTPQETKQFMTIYGNARVEEGVFKDMMTMILRSKAPGTIALYTSAIKKWVKFAEKSSYQVFLPKTKEFACYHTKLSKEGALSTSLSG